jgi:hypothetical protein
VRVILGVFGLDQPFSWPVTETVVWSCLAVSILIADIANMIYDWKSTRPRVVRTQAPQPVRAKAA